MLCFGVVNMIVLNDDEGGASDEGVSVGNTLTVSSSSCLCACVCSVLMYVLCSVVIAVQSDATLSCVRRCVSILFMYTSLRDACVC